MKALYDDLFGILSGDPSELFGVQRYLADITDLISRIDLQSIADRDLRVFIGKVCFADNILFRGNGVVAGLTVDVHVDVVGRAEVSLARSQDRSLQSFEHQLFVDTGLIGDLC